MAVGRGEDLAADGDGAFGGRHEAGDHAERRGLAAAGGAEQGDELALGQREGDVGDGAQAGAVALTEALEDEFAHV